MKNTECLIFMDEKNRSRLFEERLTKFSEKTLFFCRSAKGNFLMRSLISQLIRSATSIGANYCEANNASSKKDFRNRIFICKKEAKETEYWLRLLKTAWPERKDEINDLFQECHEFTLIFQKIISTLKAKERMISEK